MKQNSRLASDCKDLILIKTACYNILFQNHAQTDTGKPDRTKGFGVMIP